MKKGLLYLAFGEEYDKLAAHTISYSQQFTDLSICVLTNLEKRHPKWKDTKNINFIYIPLSQKDNRDVKTSLVKYTPFDLSLYIDCDSVIQRKGVEKAFDLIEENDLLLHLWGQWNVGNKVISLYKRMMLRIGVRLPIKIYIGGFFGFRKNEQVLKFFDLWNTYWKIGGKGRDMPALACAIKNSNVRIKDTLVEDKLFSVDYDNDIIIQHRYECKPGFYSSFGIPAFKKWKPFDAKFKEDWKMVLMKDNEK